MTARWLRHPVRAVLDWIGGLIVDRVFAHQAEQQKIAAANDRAVTREFERSIWGNR